MSGRGGRLSRADATVWARFVANVVPLAGRAPAESEPEAVPSRESRPEPRPASPPRTSDAPTLAPIDPRLGRRLARGTAAIDSRLDLHGLRQSEAHVRLFAFLRGAQARGDRIVLVITGKGRGEDDAEPLADRRGVLRRLVPLWLSDPALAAVVLGFGEARPDHGGAGALYVRLRRVRAPVTGRNG